MTGTLDALREPLVAACRHLAASGLSPGSSGNVSVRVGDRILMTPTGSSLARVLPEQLAIVDLDGVAEPGPAPSKEVPVHLAMYRARPDATAVVHLHSPHATAISCLPPDEHGRAALPALTPYRVMRLGDVPVAPYARPGSAELGAGVARLAPANAVVLLANHGSVVAAAGLDAAVDLAEELETAAQVTLLLRQTPRIELDAEQQRELRG
ncbi:L-fuculose-phosphate aldolase [Diaminobutyricimonas aerilata]|uniref:L-fuculose-phosphate aldolase n=1 Tax=Diaminobutyricimonas aerilata TaxID=1162967 RepID=A0A2M9CLV1_9MICO|nr:class II aldolase/adducin family protein [Diaminobutyricimonas aerilata]PJJ72870.1 L-fuculose-phosphate aldolase [Diaminobutyricimonas aerilata]